MADDRMTLPETVRKAITDGDVDFLRQGVKVLAEAVMEAEVSELTGVPKGVRDPEHRQTHRNGYRERRWDTRAGTLELGPCSRSCRRPTSWVSPPAAWSQVSRICAALDAEVEAFRGRSLEGEAYPYLWLDATYVKVRDGGRVVNMAALVAIGVSTAGDRRILGLELASGNDEGSAWPAFIGGLVERGLAGVRLVISDAHPGLVKAVGEQLLGASWQRCRVHFTRNAQDLVPRSARGMVATVIRTIFEQPDEASAREQLRRAVDGLQVRFPKVAELLVEAEADLLVHFTFPETHRPRIRSTNPLERLNKEIKRRTQVVGIFPTRASLIRLVGMVLAEQDDEWQDGRCYFRPESMALIDTMTEREEEAPALLMAS